MTEPGIQGSALDGSWSDEDRRPPTPRQTLTSPSSTSAGTDSLKSVLEMKTLFEELLPRIESLEIAGEPAWTQATLVSGPKRLPIRFTQS